MLLSKLKINPKNPQKFSDLSKLENSIKEFPKMMELRPLIYDNKTMEVLGGNKRLICLQNLGYKEIPENWAKSAETLTDEEKQRFIIADNVGFGEWDFDILDENWDLGDLEDWGVRGQATIEINEASKPDEFQEEFDSFSDSNCEMPIVPDFFENHQCFIIPCNNDIDVNFVRDLFALNKNHMSNSGDKKERKTNVIDINKLKRWAVK